MIMLFSLKKFKMIKFLDLGWQVNQVSEIKSGIDRVLTSGNYIGGSEVESFETNFSSYTGAKHCLSVGNGLDALRLSLMAAGVGPGDEVIVPAFTFIATWLAVTSIGAIIVPVDVNTEDLSINSDLLKKSITKKTKCIIPVFIFGKVCSDLDEIIAIAEENNLFLLFDSAQSSGARYINRISSRNIENMAFAWSFYPGKNLGALGDAGAVTTNNKPLADKIKILRNYGSIEKYLHIQKGLNSRMDPLQAAILSAKLKYLDSWNDVRNSQAKVYDDINSRYVNVMFGSEFSQSTNWHLYVVQTSYRTQLMKYLKNNGVETGIHYPVPPYSQQCYIELGYDKTNFSIASSASERVLSLPIGPHLSTSEVTRVVDLINLFEPAACE